MNYRKLHIDKKAFDEISAQNPPRAYMSDHVFVEEGDLIAFICEPFIVWATINSVHRGPHYFFTFTTLRDVTRARGLINVPITHRPYQKPGFIEPKEDSLAKEIVEFISRYQHDLDWVFTFWALLAFAAIGVFSSVLYACNHIRWM